MVIVLIAGILLSWPIRRANLQRRAVAALRRADSRAGLLYDFQYGADGRFKPNASPWAPAWLRRLIGDEFFMDVDTVNLQGPVTDAALATLEEFPGLRILHVRDSSKIGDGLVHLRGMSNLERLQLCGPGITDVGLVNLRGLAKLRSLDLEATGVTDAGLAYLAVLNELQSVRLVGKQGTAAGLTSRGITHVTDAGLVHLSELHHLRSLEISAAPGVDRSQVTGSPAESTHIDMAESSRHGVDKRGIGPDQGNDLAEIPGPSIDPDYRFRPGPSARIESAHEAGFEAQYGH